MIMFMILKKDYLEFVSITNMDLWINLAEK